MCGQDRAHNPLLKISKPGFRHIWPLAKLSAQARGHPKSIQSIKLPQIWLTQLLSGSLGTQIGAIFRFAPARAPTVGREILRRKRPPAFKLPGTLKPGSTQAVQPARPAVPATSPCVPACARASDQCNPPYFPTWLDVCASGLGRTQHPLNNRPLIQHQPQVALNIDSK